MSPILRTALILAGCAFIIALVYTKVPLETLTGAPSSTEENATTTVVQEKQNGAGHTVLLAGQAIRVDIADTVEGRQKGLSGRPGLAEGTGMLFVFPHNGRYGIWMKDMLFSIDILWISDEGFVVDTAKNVSPATYPDSFQPDVPSRYVLELPAGWADAHDVKIGDFVEL